MSENLGHLAGRGGLKNNLFERLGTSAEASGTPDPAVLDQLRREFLTGTGTLTGTVSFYDFLRPENRHKKVYVCNGSACLTAGTQGNLREQLEQEFGKDAVGEMCCLGRCHENNAFHFNGSNYSGTSVDQLTAITTDHKRLPDTYHIGHHGTPLLTGFANDEARTISIIRKTLGRTPQQLIDALSIAGLRGRGGAGFPMAFKLNACRTAEGTEKFIVCNADEGDPGAYSDRYLMEHQPLLVLAGILLAGYAAGANWGVVYVRAEYPESVAAIEHAIRRMRELDLCGENIQGSGFNFEFKLIKAQGAYICGEETALLSSIEGQRPEVRIRPPYPAQAGLFNLPTVVNNVETLANVPLIAEAGGESFSKIGKGKSTGTKLVSLDGFFNRPGIYEADMGTPLDTILHELGDGYRKPVKALHIGGPLGGLVPVSMTGKLTLDFESFTASGFLLGHASVVCLPAEFPVIQYIEHLFEFTAHESCGK
ncbi:MAG: formate dehydrogenase, partial [Bacteroidota bacterium]